MECPGERTRFHRRHDENRKEVIPHEEEGCQEEGHEEEGCEEEEVTRIVWTWHVLGGLAASAANPRLMQGSLEAPLLALEECDERRPQRSWIRSSPRAPWL